MSDGFIRKKVESLTLGEKLKKLRQQYRMSFAEIAKATRIQAKYLEYLENGSYEKLPAEVYVRGFLKSYARHLGLDDDAFLKLYDKEKHIRANLGQERTVKAGVRYPTMNVWIVTPRTVFFVILFSVLGGTCYYLFTEFRSFVAEPRLTLANPLPGATIDGSLIVLQGQTDPGAAVVVNGEPVFVGSDGTFAEELTLQQGLNRILVRATNRFNNSKEEILAVESRVNATPPSVSSTAPEENGWFILRAIDQRVNVTLSYGERVLYSGTLVPEKAERFQVAEGKVRLTTDDALHTEIQQGNAPPERVGTTATPVSNQEYLITQTSNSESVPTNP